MKRTVAFEKNARNIFFHVLTQCNLSCRHCYVDPCRHGKKPVSLETARAWLSALSSPGGTGNLVLLGGEPTLHPDLPGIARAARKLGYGSITVDTNGFLFHDFLHRVTPAEVDTVSFSMDSPTARENDALRGPGAFDACVKGIREAVRLGFSVSVIYTVSGANLTGLSAMPAILTELGVDRFFIQVIGLRGRGAGAVQVGRWDWEGLVSAAALSAAKSGLTVLYPKVYLDEGEPFSCAGRDAENYFVFPNGRVYRCPLCEDYPVHAHRFQGGRLIDRPGITERRLFELTIPEGCVMNRLVQPGSIDYDASGKPLFKVACCMLKEEMSPG